MAGKTSKIRADFEKGIAFKITMGDHSFYTDGSVEMGGHDMGPRPKPLLLSALAGCSGVDVVMILKKMRVDFQEFSIDIEGELTEEHPKYYHTVKMTYRFKGRESQRAKMEKAVTLSLDRYCGVAYTISKAGAKIDYDIVIEPIE